MCAPYILYINYIIYYYFLCKYLLSKEINNKEKFSFVKKCIKRCLAKTSFLFETNIKILFFDKNLLICKLSML